MYRPSNFLLALSRTLSFSSGFSVSECLSSPVSGSSLPSGSLSSFMRGSSLSKATLSLLWGAGLPSLDDEGRIFVYVDLFEVSPETEEEVSRDNEAGRSQGELL
jgi:hypothetical protein